MESGDGSAFGIVFLLVFLMLYFLPALVAQARGRDGQLAISFGNLFLGWTVIGWVVLLVIAFTGESASVRKMREEQLMLMRRMADRQQPLE